MAEVAFAVVLVALIAAMAVGWEMDRRERRHLLHLLVARNPAELRLLEQPKPPRRAAPAADMLDEDDDDEMPPDKPVVPVPDGWQLVDGAG